METSSTRPRWLWTADGSAVRRDVLETEPPPKDSPLIGRPNVVLTPHTAFYSVEALEELQTKCATDVARVLLGQPPVYPAPG